MDETPPFASAIETFREFLRGQGISEEIRWIWRDFIFTRRAPGSRKSWNRPIFIDGRVTADVADVERYYSRGVERGLGIALCVFCLADGVTCCYILLPNDETDAEYRMMSSLKCQVPTPLPAARLVRNAVLRAMLRLLLRPSENTWIKDVPTQAGAVA